MAQRSVLDDHVETLSEDGIVIIEDYLEEELCDRLYNDIMAEVENDRLKRAPENPSYGDLATADEPILNVRSGKTDEGMLDIFNMDLVMDELDSIKNDSFVNELIDRAEGEPYSPININVYIRESVTNPSPYHADTYDKVYKAFLYLTDVPTDAYGPFCYVKGSHDASKLKRLFTLAVNHAKGNRGAPRAVYYDESNEIHCTAPKGTLIVANQAGYHRAHPQEEGKERVLLTTTFNADSSDKF